MEGDGVFFRNTRRADGGVKENGGAVAPPFFDILLSGHGSVVATAALDFLDALPLRDIVVHQHLGIGRLGCLLGMLGKVGIYHQLFYLEISGVDLHIGKESKEQRKRCRRRAEARRRS